MIIFLVGNQMEYIVLNLNHYILLSYIAKENSGYRMGMKVYKDSLAAEQKKYLTKILNV